MSGAAQRREIAGRTACRRRSLACLALAAALALPTALHAAEAPASASLEEPAAAPRSAILESAMTRTANDLEAIAGRISLTEETIRALDAEIAAIAADRDRVREAMIAAAARQKEITAEITATEERIDALVEDEAAIKVSLRARRGLLAEVLGALQRMGRKPPPALLVKPEDALGSVRSAILLGSVVPSIREETDRLVADLRRLSDVKDRIVEEKQRFGRQLVAQREEEERLARLFGEKEKLEADNRGRREAARRRAAELAEKATSLQDLIASLEAEVESARAAEAAAEKLAEEQRLAAERRAADLAAEAEARRLAEAKAKADAEAERLAEAARPQTPPAADEPPAQARPAVEEPPSEAEIEVAALPPEPPEPEPAPPGYDIASLRRDVARLEPLAAFSTLKGSLSAPVAGKLRIGFGEEDDIGVPASGATFAAQAGDLVTAPADGRVLYAGPFRSYGELLILDAGDGYHVVLAGMSRIDVEVGQFVLSGEPVAMMGARRLASVAGTDFEATEPMLYVEFRKDGKPVDPSPWWTEGPSGRTRNDS